MDETAGYEGAASGELAVSETSAGLGFLEQSTASSLGLAAVHALKRQADIRDLLDRLGMDAKKAGGVQRSRFKEVIQGEWSVWDRLMKAIKSGIQSDTIAYGQAKWPELMTELERSAELRKGRGWSSDDYETVMRNSLTFTQKVLVCLRRIASEGEIDINDGTGNDSRCVRFIRKLGHTLEKEDTSDVDRARMLHYETIRLMDLKMADGSSLRTAAKREAGELLDWLEEQQSVEGKMTVPRFGEGLTVEQLTEALAAKLVTRGAEEKTIERSVGVNSRKARQLARDAEKKAKAGDQVGSKKRSLFTKRELIERGELKGRVNLAKSMLSGEQALGSWIGRLDELMVRVSAQEVRFVTADLEEAKVVVDWMREEHGPGAKDLRVLVTRKDDAFLSEGFVHAIRKTLTLQENQVTMEKFTWRSDAERIGKARGQIVMCIEVVDSESVGRIRGMYTMAKTMCRKRELTPHAVMAIHMSAWEAAWEAMNKNGPPATNW